MIGLNPHHHNPTGTRLSAARRRAVADVAADYGVPLVEDRVAAELAFDGVVPPPLAVHRPDGAFVTVDSFSKLARGGLRIGWVRADAGTIQLLRTSKALADLWSPIPSQVLALTVIDHLDELTRERIARLRTSERLLADELARHLPDWKVARVRGGMVAWARLPSGSAAAFCRFATRFGVAIAGGREFSTSTVVDDHVRIPFTRPDQTVSDAVERLAAAWAAFPPARLDDPMPATSIV